MVSRCKVLLVAAAFAMIQAVAAQDRTESTSTDALPSKALIAGVPFVGWGEAAQVDYPNKDILNPAVTAVQMMEQKFWGFDPTRFRLLAPRLFVAADWQSGDNRIGLSLDELKRPIASGMPVYVQLTLTPYANPLPLSASIDSSLRDHGKAPDGRGGSNLSRDEVIQLIQLEKLSGALGRMEALETLRVLGTSRGSIKDQWGHTHSAEYLYLLESLYSAPRLLIGYDDERRVMIVHDPSFGPALEIGYDDFDTMWRYSERRFSVSAPEGPGRIAAKRTSNSPYPPRTPDMQAALHYVTGYALAAIGRAAEAEEAFARGLAVPKISQGYRFMLAYETARLTAVTHRPDEAIAALRLATDAVPQACDTWTMLAKLYRQNPSLPDADRLAVEADARSKSICSDRAALAAFVKAIPRDFWVVRLAKYRGWGYEMLGR